MFIPCAYAKHEYKGGPKDAPLPILGVGLPSIVAIGIAYVVVRRRAAK
jgi:hypothetical protein